MPTRFNMSDPLTREQIAWLAGFIDGEGSIGIARSRDKRKGSDYRAYRGMLQISNTCREALEWVCLVIGDGQIVHTRLRNPLHQEAFQYKLRSQEVLADVLTAIHPFLKIKQQQADLVLYFLLRRLGRTLDKPFVRGWYRPYDKTDHQLYLRSRALNVRGKDKN